VRWRKKVVTKERTMFTNILIPTDGSELAGQAVPYGIALTNRIGANAAVTTVLPAFFTCVFATSIKVSLSSLNSVVQTLDVSILQMTASQ
jgi:nucleotide-binding universal stress UspA family protein